MILNSSLIFSHKDLYFYSWHPLVLILLFGMSHVAVFSWKLHVLQWNFSNAVSEFCVCNGILWSEYAVFRFLSWVQMEFFAFKIVQIIVGICCRIWWWVTCQVRRRRVFGLALSRRSAVPIFRLATCLDECQREKSCGRFAACENKSDASGKNQYTRDGCVPIATPPQTLKPCLANNYERFHQNTTRALKNSFKTFRQLKLHNTHDLTRIPHMNSWMFKLHNNRHVNNCFHPKTWKLIFSTESLQLRWCSKTDPWIQRTKSWFNCSVRSIKNSISQLFGAVMFVLFWTTCVQKLTTQSVPKCDKWVRA